MATRGGGISTTAVVAVVVGGVLAWSGLRGWKVSLVLKDFLSGVDPRNDPELQKKENQLPISVGGLVSDAFGSLIGSIIPKDLPKNPSFGIPLIPADYKGGQTNADANFAIAKAVAAQMGWSQSEIDAWYTLGMKESGWNNVAQNPTSTAFGIGQFLDSTWAKYGPKTSDPNKQVLYMAQYIRDRYGTPSAALAFHRANNWY